MKALLDRRLLIGARVLVGTVFVLSGFLKLLQPWEEFAAQIRAFQVLPSGAVDPFAMVLPWAELLIGGLLLAGVMPRMVSLAAGLLLALFIVAIGSVMIRGIPLEDCGCFGAIGIKETPPMVFVRDLILLALLVPMAYRAFFPEDYEEEPEEESGGGEPQSLADGT